jgi:hypothetical protein
VVGFLPIFWKANANAESWFDGQEILIECPAWEWAPSPLTGVEYEICFDDVEHCTVAQIGDSVCIPSTGVFDVWVTAIYNQNGTLVYFDGDVASALRVVSADFDGDGIVGFSDFGFFTEFFGNGGESPGDLDGDGYVGFLDFAQFSNSFGKCVNPNGVVYEPC